MHVITRKHLFAAVDDLKIFELLFHRNVSNRNMFGLFRLRIVFDRLV
jgi:hypothetical protein